MTLLPCARDGAAGRRARGFTLVELVITMIVIGILAVFAVSRMDFRSVFEERAYHDKLKAGVQFARKAAVAQRRYVCVAAASNVVTFTVDTNVPEFYSSAPSCASVTAPLNLPAPDKSCGGAGNTICAPSGVTLTPSAASFQFDARGGASATVTFASTNQPTITVEQETGYVH